MNNIFKLIQALALKGHMITVQSKNGKMFYDMNTGAKSHLHVYAEEQSGKLLWEARYDQSGEMELSDDVEQMVDDITSIVHSKCMCGRDFVNSSWLERFIEYGYVNA